ncbi:hypothetical protein HK098_007880 [Nowakowskiella sp. JEL0407]|nr:hypothetical protein HK098_007880 [Nowakowskiella sp. JEL0407]
MAAQLNVPAGSYLPGTLLKVNARSLLVEKFLAEGGFAHVYLVRISDLSMSNNSAAVLKRMICPDEKTMKEYLQEVEIMKLVNGHKNIVQYYDFSVSNLSGGGFEIFILMEYCERGHLVDYLNTKLSTRLTEMEVLSIFCDICEAVAHMHYGSGHGIILHRDIKVENVLLMSNGTFKLCDFGSATRKIIPPRTVFSAPEIKELEEEINKYTTIQYRAPELLDLYQKLGITDKVDVWALGIFLYKLCYFTTPFEESGTLAAINGRFTFPDFPPYSPALKNLISATLNPNPQNRPNVYDIAVIACSMRGVLCTIKPPPIEFTQMFSYEREQQSLPVPKPLRLQHSQESFFEKKVDQSYLQPMRRGRPTPKQNQTSPLNMDFVGGMMDPPVIQRVHSLSQNRAIIADFDPLQRNSPPQSTSPSLMSLQSSNWSSVPMQPYMNQITTQSFPMLNVNNNQPISTQFPIPQNGASSSSWETFGTTTQTHSNEKTYYSLSNSKTGPILHDAATSGGFFMANNMNSNTSQMPGFSYGQTSFTNNGIMKNMNQLQQLQQFSNRSGNYLQQQQNSNQMQGSSNMDTKSAGFGDGRNNGRDSFGRGDAFVQTLASAEVKYVGEGELCGGFIANAAMCSPGLICVHTNLNPDFPGRCRKPAKTTTSKSPSPTPNISGEGGPCGGFILNPPVCAPGLVCVHSSLIADIPGKCTKPTKSTTTTVASPTRTQQVNGEGGSCGGFVIPPAPICSPGLTCVYRTDIADLPGVCTKVTTTKSSPTPTKTQQVNGEGGSCGGFVIPPAPICSPGLVCVYRTDVADLPGVCKKPTKTTTTIAPTKTPEVNGVGGRCCGFVVPPAPECSPGLECRCPPDDSFGVCYDPKATTTKSVTRRTIIKLPPTPM